MKLKRYTVRNFQSIAELTLYFKPSGVYIITGLNNIGKSAEARSMDSHFYNSVHQQYKKDYIRDGCEYYETESETYEGHIITQKRGGVNSYDLTNPDGTVEPTFYKLERGVPEKIRDIFNFYIDPVSKEKLNYRSSKANLMLVTTTPRETYDIIQYAIKTTEINEAIKEGKASIKEADDELEVISGKMDLLEAQIDEIVILDLSDLENAVDTLKDLDQVVVTLCNMCETYEKVEELDIKLDELNDLKGLFDEFNALKAVVNASENIIENYEKYEEVSAKIEESTVELDNMKKCAELAKLVELCSSYIENSDKLVEIEQKIEESTIEIPGSLYTDISVISTCESIVDTMKKYTEVQAEETRVKNEIKALQEQKTGLFKQYGYCPVCNSKFDDKHSHENGGE